jgi:hypothetical protein
VYDSIESVSLFTEYGKATWEAQEALDPERLVHKGYGLYLVWNMKQRFVMEAIDSNPWRSDYFFWVDIGCQRSALPSLHVWPDDNRVAKIPHDKVVYTFVDQSLNSLNKYHAGLKCSVKSLPQCLSNMPSRFKDVRALI